MKYWESDIRRELSRCSPTEFCVFPLVVRWWGGVPNESCHFPLGGKSYNLEKDRKQNLKDLHHRIEECIKFLKQLVEVQASAFSVFETPRIFKRLFVQPRNCKTVYFEISTQSSSSK